MTKAMNKKQRDSMGAIQGGGTDGVRIEGGTQRWKAEYI